MTRLALLLVALGGAACGTETDDRPATLPYVTEAVLQPACGQAECHSTFHAEHGFILDTVAGARETLVRGVYLVWSESPSDSQLATILTTGVPIGGGAPERMPYDQPIPNYDTYLIKAWIGTGSSDAFGPPDAQCYPAVGTTDDDGIGCDVNGNLVACVDGGAGDPISDPAPGVVCKGPLG